MYTFKKYKKNLPRSVNFLSINSDNKLFYNGKCKIFLNKITKKVIIQPYNEGIKFITVSFESNILSDTNIIFIDSVNDKIVLIFDNQNICKKITDLIYQQRSIKLLPFDDTEYVFEQKVLLPLIENLHNSEISNVLAKFINLCDNDKKNKVLNFLQKHGVNCSAWIEQNINRHYNFRKRSYMESKNDNINNDKISKKLFKSSPKNISTTIIYKPDYEIINDDLQKRWLIIFELTNKELCYEYFCGKNQQYFHCVGCYKYFNQEIGSLKRLRKSTSAKLYHYGTDKEYVKMFDFNHICDLRPYNPAKFLRQLIYSSMFEIKSLFKNGKEIKKLYIFATEENIDQKYCYKFDSRKNGKSFRCRTCNSKGLQVSAKLINDKNGLECIRMGKTLHICKPQLYTYNSTTVAAANLCKSEITIKKPEFTFVPSELGYNPKLIIFDKNDKNLCYEFSSSATAFYYCIGCSKLNNGWPNFYAKYQKNANGEENIILKNEKHACKSLKFDPTKYKPPTTIKPSNYMFYKNAKGIPKMIIFASEDKKFCYNYFLNNRDKIWYCTECTKQKKLISAKVRADFEGKEYLQLGNVQHICEPLKYSYLLKSTIDKIVKSTDIVAPKRLEGKGVISAAPFELRPNKNGIKNQILITFISTDKKSDCYVYDYKVSSKSFNCRICIKKRACVSAKLCEKDGKEYIMLGQKQHICKPIKYDTLK